MDNQSINFKSIGRNCKISPFARFYNPENIEIGNNVRIDDFCILSAGIGGIKIGRNCHIACFTHLIGAGEIVLEDYAQVSSRSSIFSSTDDFGGRYLAGPCVADEMRKVRSGKVHLKKYTLLGCGTIIMPEVTIGEGSATGAQTLVTRSIPDFELHGGTPNKKLKDREKPFFFYGNYAYQLSDE